LTFPTTSTPFVTVLAQLLLLTGLTPTPTAKDDEEDDEALEDREKLLRRGLDKFETVST
jgi:hypothetical protein